MASPAPPDAGRAGPLPAQAEALARRLCDAPHEAAAVPAGQALAVGWALKAACYAAWSSEPPRAVQAAEALRALTGHAAGDPALAALAPLADWTEGIACLVKSDMAAAVDALDAASAGWRALDEPLPAAQAQVPKVMALAVLGRFDEAEAGALATEAALRAAGDAHAAAKVRLNLGTLAFSRDEHAQALGHYRAAAVAFARAGDREHSVMADVGQADALGYLGRFDEARGLYTRARLRASAHGLPVLAASADNGLALIDLSQGRYREALAGLEAARRVFAALALEHRVVELEKSLADAYLELRLLPEAIGLYRGLADALKAQGAGATLPWVQVQLARALAGSKRVDAALATLAEASCGFEAQGNAAGHASVRMVQAALHAAAGQPRAALDRALEAGAAFGRAGLAAHRLQAQVEAAAARTACGEPQQARADCDALLADPALPPQWRVRAQAARAEALLALAAARPGDGGENGVAGASNPETLREARAALEAAIDGTEELRAVLPGDDLRRAFLADASRPYAQRLQLALGDADPAAVLHWLERFKARALQDRLGRQAPRAAAGGDAGALRARLAWIYRRQQQRVEDDGDAPQALREEAARLEGRLLEDARRERLLRPPDAAAHGAALDARALAATLGEGRGLVAYGVVGDELFALVARAGGLRLLRRVALWPQVRQAVEGLRFQIDTVRSGAALAGAHAALLRERAQRRLAQLHALVWQPLEGCLDGLERLVIVPHGALHGVPFAALGPLEGDALADRHELVLAASAGVAVRGLRAPGDRFVPDAPDVPDARDAPDAPIEALLMGDSRRLPHVAAELAAVARIFGTPPLDGEAATVGAFAAGAPRADLLHLACHAVFRADSPLHSALHLADGALTAEQVEGYALKARLVVLSACESALGDAGVADEGVGLVRAFLIAGAHSVLGSLWAVDDESSAELMAGFHAGWRAGASPATALRAAQRALRERRPHPAHWAAFALHGAP